MKFRIVENPDLFEGIDVDEFKKDNKNLTMKEMCKKYNTHNKKIYKLRKQLGLSPKKPKRATKYSFAKYYFYSSNSDTWKVQKRNEYFGSFKTEEEAKKAVNFLKENNWSKEQLLKNKKKIFKEADKHKEK